MRTKILFFVLLIAAVVASFWAFSEYQKRKDIQVVFQNGSENNLTVEVYKTKNYTDEVSAVDYIVQSKRVIDTTTNLQATLRAGTYVYNIYGSDDYEQTTGIFNVINDGDTLTIDPPLSSKRLGDILEQEKSAINKALSSKFPKIIKQYKVSYQEIFLDGSWYAAVLDNRSTNNQKRIHFDQYRVVLNKVDGEWVVKTDPPQILLNVHDYPDIPREVLVGVNKNTSTGQ